MPKQLPKTLFVKIDGEGDEAFYNAADKASHLVEMGQKAKIGTYQLVETSIAEGVASIKKASR